MTVVITPSHQDLGLTEGLCQNYENIKTGKGSILEPRANVDGTNATANCPGEFIMTDDIKEFIKSWR